MTEPLRISQARSAADMIAVRELFVEYAEAIQVDLCFQQFDEELEKLPGRNAPPAGELLLAYAGEDLAGCVGMRDLGEGIAEMKRLFVRPAYRSARLGRRLVEQVIKVAKERGYQRMRLDTLASMESAIGLYRSLGFVEIESYCHNPIVGARYFEVSL